MMESNLPTPRTMAHWLVFVSLETTAQLTLKVAAVGTMGPGGAWGWLQALASNPWFQASIACDVANFLVWMAILRRHDLSVAIPLSALCYFSIIIASSLLLHEPVSVPQVAGLALIGLGIFWIARK